MSPPQAGTGKAVIAGMSSAMPPPRSQDELWDAFADRHFQAYRWSKRIYDSAGVRQRHPAFDPLIEDVSAWSTGARMQRYLAEAMPLAKSAATGALDDAGIDAADIGLLAVVSCTGYSTPGVDLCLARDLGLGPAAERVVVGHMGCHAALPAIGMVADSVCSSGRPALLLCVELCSLHIQPASPNVDQILAHALFSDAAAAVVIAPVSSAGTSLQVLDREAFTDSSSAAHITWDVTDLGFRMGLSRQLPELLGRYVAPTVANLLDRHGARPEDVVAWAVHPGGLGILDSVARELRLPPQSLAASRHTLADNGNCSSATVLLVLEELRRRGQLQPGGLAAMLAFGPGLTLYATLLRA